MSIRLAKKIGFCFGVRRAVRMAEEALDKKKPIYSLGSIIHNEQVVGVLSRKGLKVIKDIDSIDSGTIIISSHGIGPEVARKIASKGLEIIDTTCPFVLKAQNIAKRLGREAVRIVVVGDRHHPEVKALVGFAPKDICVVKNSEDARKLCVNSSDRISVMSQTTQSTGNFMDVVDTVREKRPLDLKVYNTICMDAEERQRSARELARAVDVMLIIGGKDSANTKRLFEVCREISKNSHWVQTEAGVRKNWFKPGGAVGIASGASTPDWVIQRVVDKIEQIQKKSKERGCVRNGRRKKRNKRTRRR